MLWVFCKGYRASYHPNSNPAKRWLGHILTHCPLSNCAPLKNLLKWHHAQRDEGRKNGPALLFVVSTVCVTVQNVFVVEM